MVSLSTLTKHIVRNYQNDDDETNKNIKNEVIIAFLYFSRITNFTDCLSSARGLYKCDSAPNTSRDSSYHFAKLRKDFLTFACSIPEGEQN